MMPEKNRTELKMSTTGNKDKFEEIRKETAP